MLRYSLCSFLNSVVGGIQTTISSSIFLEKLHFYETTESMKLYNFFGRDILGQLGSLVFISKKYNCLDNLTLKNAKNIQNFQVCTLSSELLIASYFVNDIYLFGMLSSINILKNMSWIYSGSLNISCMNSLSSSEKETIQEIYARISIVNTLGFSIGTMMGIGILGMCEKYGIDQMSIAIVTGSINLFILRQMIKNIKFK